MSREYSKHQRNIIKNYYDNYEQIQLQKLQENLTELYLAEGKAREKRWKNIVAALENLKVPASRIEHVRGADNAQLLAKLIEELLAKHQ
jgi:DNA-binding ferritin-like protein (Dps family)